MFSACRPQNNCERNGAGVMYRAIPLAPYSQRAIRLRRGTATQKDLCTVSGAGHHGAAPTDDTSGARSRGVRRHGSPHCAVDQGSEVSLGDVRLFRDRRFFARLRSCLPLRHSNFNLAK